jgi:plasmid stabilization system protein ParE
MAMQTMRFGAASRRSLALGPGSPSTPLRCVAGVRERAVERASGNSIHCFPGRMQRKRNVTRDPAQDSAAKRRKTHFAEGLLRQELHPGSVAFRERSEAGWGVILARLAAVPGRGRLRPRIAVWRRTVRNRPRPVWRDRGAGARLAIVISLRHRGRCCPSSSGCCASSSGFWRVIVGIVARHRRAGVAPRPNGG